MEKKYLVEMGRRYPTNPVSPTLKIVFKKDGITALTLLSLLAHKDLVEFELPKLVDKIVCSRDWGKDSNRKIRANFPLGHVWSEPMLLDRAANGIKSIRIANENPLNALLTGRQEKQQEVAAEIIAQTLTPEFRQEVEDWGFSVTAELTTEIEGFPGIEILISNGDETVVETLLDGWSGCIFINHEIQPLAFGDVEYLHRVIMNAAMSYIG